MIDSLLHLARATCLDIANAVATVSKFSSEPMEAHLTAEMINLLLHYTSTEQKMIGYFRSRLGHNLEGRRSTSGAVFLIAGGAASWLNQKQPTVALSTSEAELWL